MADVYYHLFLKNNKETKQSSWSNDHDRNCDFSPLTTMNDIILVQNAFYTLGRGEQVLD